MPLAYIITSLVKLSFFFLSTELLFLHVDCRLCLSLGAVNIYQDQLYILELRKIYLTILMAVKKPLQSHREKREKMPGTPKNQRKNFSLFLFLLPTPTILPIFSPNCIFFLSFFAELNACFSVPLPLCSVESMHI